MRLITVRGLVAPASSPADRAASRRPHVPAARTPPDQPAGRRRYESAASRSFFASGALHATSPAQNDGTGVGSEVFRTLCPVPYPLLRDHQLHAPVLLPPGSRLVRRNRLGVALAHG